MCALLEEQDTGVLSRYVRESRTWPKRGAVRGREEVAAERRAKEGGCGRARVKLCDHASRW